MIGIGVFPPVPVTQSPRNSISPLAWNSAGRCRERLLAKLFGKFGGKEIVFKASVLVARDDRSVDVAAALAASEIKAEMRGIWKRPQCSKSNRYT
jgi:hypothetical protein